MRLVYRTFAANFSKVHQFEYKKPNKFIKYSISKVYLLYSNT